MLRYLLISLIFTLPTYAAQSPLVLEHLTVIDGTGSPARPNMSLIVTGHTITALYPDGQQAAPQNAVVKNMTGRYVIPGLIDAHVHLTGAVQNIAQYQTLLHQLVSGGVTSVRDMAGDSRLLGYLARQANNDSIIAPDIFYSALLSGPSFFAEDKRAQAASIGEPIGFAPWMQAISGDTNIPLAIAQAKGTGATGIKLYGNLPAAMVKALSKEAHRQGLKVWTHGTVFPASPQDAVMAGADSLSHTPYLVWQGAKRIPDDYRVRAQGDFLHIPPDSPAILALLTQMKRHHTILDATLQVFANEQQHHPEKVAKGLMSWSYQVTQLAHQQGIPVDAGSDSAGLPHTKSGIDMTAMPVIHQEMAQLVEHCGFSPIEAIQAATQYSAMASGHGADRGVIAVGRKADLVILKHNPGTNIHYTTAIDWVMKNGRIIGG